MKKSGYSDGRGTARRAHGYADDIAAAKRALSTWPKWMSPVKEDITEIQRLQEAIGRWQEETFRVGGPESTIAHLKKEVEEELAKQPYDRMEYADCLILLLSAYYRAGGSADDLVAAAFQKMAVNRRRRWGEPDENGVIEHIRESEQEGSG